MGWKDTVVLAANLVVKVFLVMLFMGAAFWGVDMFFNSRRDKTPCAQKCACSMWRRPQWTTAASCAPRRTPIRLTPND